MRKTLLVGSAALAWMMLAVPAFAGFATSVSGNGALVSPPSSALGDVSTQYQVWNESSGTLSSALTVENNGAVGSYSGMSPGTSTTLAAGTSYGSTFVQLNPGIDGTVHSGMAFINFSTAIIGVALSGTTNGVPGSLDLSDKYGAAGTTYPTGYSVPPNNRGILDKTNQFFTILNGGKELEVQLTANFDGFKELRVFTQGGSVGAVPEPASMVVWTVLGSVVAGGAWYRRRRA